MLFTVRSGSCDVGRGGNALGCSDRCLRGPPVPVARDNQILQVLVDL